MSLSPTDSMSASTALSISGHKMIGSPLPCGIALTKREYVARVARSIEYVGVLDTTLTGSRSAITPLMIWYALEKHGLGGFKRIVNECLDKAEYAVTRFRDSGIPAWRNKNSVTVVLPKPSPEVILQMAACPLRGYCPYADNAARNARDYRRSRG